MIIHRFLCILTFIGLQKTYSQPNFVSVLNDKFFVDTQSYTFFGTNYWYGGYLAADTLHNGKQRLTEELDFLKYHGVKNLRVMIASEGTAEYPYRIYPSLQEKPGIFSEDILKGFDLLIVEAAKRSMKLVFVLNNNWEWSGGFGQYLEWAGYKNPILPKTSNWDWDNYCDYISKFYSCDSCLSHYQNFIYKIIGRKNSISKINYSDEPAIMTWELANEPRPMRKSAISDYEIWVRHTSRLIKSIDKNHLVTIGTEGIIGTMQDSMLYERIHNLSSIDYLTIHIWPKTWNWYDGESSSSTADSTLQKTRDYIELHARLSKRIKKPLVIEEFGLHRDQNVFVEFSPTSHRDTFIQFVYRIGNENHVSGYNFWGSFGMRDKKMEGDYWKKGTPYGADPPQEEQGLYGVYPSDTSTWNHIKRMGISD